ncbi:hypothetical protein ACOBQJ_10090 [Pelotomaculum propionicicum]|uniref:hypothetical protein n=1 Tax=Pelotomaculum propionicicum TaxID=258475 RepID=UPI003B784C80
MPDSKTVKTKPGQSKIHEPLSSYYPPPFTVEKPTMQNVEPEYRPHSAVYVKNEKAREKKNR